MFIVSLKTADLLKKVKTKRCPGVLRLQQKLHQAACFTRKALVQSKFH